jgi:hypothetical protein
MAHPQAGALATAIELRRLSAGYAEAPVALPSQALILKNGIMIPIYERAWYR